MNSILGEAMNNDDKIKLAVEVWKTIVSVQQHFNEIGMKIRGLFITILLAIFASIGFLLDKEFYFQLHTVSIMYYTLIPLFGIMITYLFYFIDRYWYHRLLVGAVKQGTIIEEKYAELLPELSLGLAIGKESPYEPTGIGKWLARLIVKHKKYRETGKMHSDAKIEFFYKSVILFLFLLTIFFFVLDGVRFS